MAPSRRDSFASYRTPRAPYLQTSSDAFGLVDAGAIERSFVAAARQLRQQLLRLVDDRAAGRLSSQVFVGRSKHAIRSGYFSAYALGAISIFPFYTLTDRDVRILDEELDEETGFLRGFSADLGAGHLDMEAVRRAGLYLLALRGIFERGRTEAMPAGPYEWALGATEHCLDCIRTAEDGPYQRERYSGLGLPALPGAPGDGSVCRGLTQCGCTVKLANGSLLPNPDLPMIIRSKLVEVVYGSSSAASGTTVE
jgi:hypothetical protein